MEPVAPSAPQMLAVDNTKIELLLSSTIDDGGSTITA